MATEYDAIAGEVYRRLDSIPPDRSSSINFVKDVRASFERGLRLHLKLQSQVTKWVAKHDKHGNPVIQDFKPASSFEYPALMAQYGEEFIVLLDNTLRRGVSKKTAIKYAGNAYRYDRDFFNSTVKFKEYAEDEGYNKEKTIPDSMEELALLLSEESEKRQRVAMGVVQYRIRGSPEATDYLTPPDPEPAYIDDEDDEDAPDEDETPEPVTPETPDDEVAPNGTTPAEPTEPTPVKDIGKTKRTTGTRRKPQDKRKPRVKAKTTPEAQPAKPADEPTTSPEVGDVEPEPVVVKPAPKQAKEKKKKEEAKAKTKPKGKTKEPVVEILRPLPNLKQLPKPKKEPVTIDGEGEDITHRTNVPSVDLKPRDVAIRRKAKPLEEVTEMAHDKKRSKASRIIIDHITSASESSNDHSLSSFERRCRAYQGAVRDMMSQIGLSRSELESMAPPVRKIAEYHRSTYNTGDDTKDHQSIKNLIRGLKIAKKYGVHLSDLEDYWPAYSKAAEGLLLNAFGAHSSSTRMGANESVQFDEFKRRWNLMKREGYIMDAIAEYSKTRRRVKSFLKYTRNDKRGAEYRRFFTQNGIV